MKIRIYLLLVFLSFHFMTFGQKDKDKPPKPSKDTTVVITTAPENYGQKIEAPLRIIPKTPEASVFEKFINFPPVSGTGIPEISIPLYTLKYKGFSLPVSLSYHAGGIKVNDVATPVGLNWVLNAGGFVSRDIIGLADEYGWFSFDSIKASTSCVFDILKPYYEGVYDVAPDVYNYFIPGKSGKFIFKSDKSIRKSNCDPVKIVFDEQAKQFIIYDEYGNEYLFLPRENTAIDVTDNHGGIQTASEHLNGSGLVGWKLDKITLPAGQVISFTYVEYNYLINWYRTSNYYTFLGARVHCSISEEGSSGFSSTQIQNQTFLIESILTPDEKIQFEYRDDNQLSVMKKKLGKISVINRLDNDTIQVIKLNHTKYEGDPRLKLTGVEFLGQSSTNQAIKYSFNYYPGSLLTMGNCGQDLFGYYNGNTVEQMIPVNVENRPYFIFSPANREVNPGLVATGVLSEIVYPTGGRSRYTYEANSIGGTYAPGVRIREIEFLNSDGASFKKNQFEYADLTGYTHLQNDFSNYYSYYQAASGNPPRFRDERQWTSTPIFYMRNNFEHNTGFFYGEVRTKSLAGTIVGNTTVEKYSGYTDIFTLTPYLRERVYRDINNYNVKKERFQYSNNASAYKGWIPYLSYMFYGYDYCNGNREYCQPVMGYTPLNVFSYAVNRLSLDKKVDLEFSNNGNDSVKIETDFLYNKFQLPIKIVSTTSVANEKTIRYIHYADDYTLTGLPWLNLMKENSKYRIGLPIDQRTYRLSNQEYLTEGSLNEYSENGQLLNEYRWFGTTPSASNIWNSGVFISTDFQLENSYLYDSYKNEVETKFPSGATTYLWSYNNKYPVAKIENATYVQVSTALGGSFINTLALATNQATIGNYLSQLRNTLSANLPAAFVSTYTFKPFGISSETDQAGKTVYYEYDSFGRLKLIRDFENNIVKKTEYHYAGQ